MNRITLAAAFALLSVSLTYAQVAPRSHSAFPTGTIEGRILDDNQTPVAGAMVSVVGRITAAATTGRDGKYSLKDLPYGPYVLSVHSRGFWQSRGRTVQLADVKMVAPEIQLAHASDKGAAVGGPKTSQAPQLASFGGFDLPAAPAASPPAAVAEPAPANADSDSDSDDGGETAWRLRHLPRSVLKEAAIDPMWVSQQTFTPRGDWFGRAIAVGPAALFGDLALSGQINLLTTESFDHARQVFDPAGGRSVAFVSVGTQAAGGAWAMQGAMTQGDLASWAVAGSYKSIASASHAYDVGLSYSTQRYDGGNAAALAAVRDNARNAGALYGYDQWTVSPRLIVGYGTGFARYDYIESGLWSPRLSVTIPVDGFRLKAVASHRALAPGAEEFSPMVAGIWLPPERTFSSLSADGVFRPEQTRHTEVALERDLAGGVSFAVRGFTQRVDDQLIEVFGVDLPGRPETPLGHYFVGTAGDVDSRGWGVAMIQEVPGYVKGTLEYTVATAYWRPSSDPMNARVGRSALAPWSENLYDLQTTIEATIPQTATKVYAKYRMNTAFWSPEADSVIPANSNARFNVRVNQSLPFMRFSNADWEMLVDVRNSFREMDNYVSLYDEALAIRAPKRIVGGLLVKF